MYRSHQPGWPELTASSSPPWSFWPWPSGSPTWAGPTGSTKASPSGSPPIRCGRSRPSCAWTGHHRCSTSCCTSGCGCSALLPSLPICWPCWCRCWRSRSGTGPGRDLFDRRAGLAAAALFATNPFLGWYSTETRMYPIVVVLAIVGLTFAVRAVRDPPMAGRHRRGPGLHRPPLHPQLGHLPVRGHGSPCWPPWQFPAATGKLAVAIAAASAAVMVLWLPWVPGPGGSGSEHRGTLGGPPSYRRLFADPASALGGTLGVVVAPLLAAGAWWTRRRRPLGGRRAGPGVGCHRHPYGPGRMAGRPDRAVLDGPLPGGDRGPAPSGRGGRAGTAVDPAAWSWPRPVCCWPGGAQSARCFPIRTPPTPRATWPPSPGPRRPTWRPATWW